MATVVDRLITELLLAGGKYIEEADRVTAATSRMASGMTNAGRIALQAGAALATGAAGLVAVAVGVGKSAFDAYGRMESLTKGLVAVSGSSAEAASQLERLKQIAQSPGLDLAQAIKGTIALQAVTFSAAQSERALLAFGNAIATVGGGPADLEGVIYGLRQIGGAPTILGEDLNIIKERAPQVAAALQKLYGTARSEDLAKLGIAPKRLVMDLVGEMEKLPQVSGGAENSVVNLGSAIEQAMAKAGGVVASIAVPVMDRLASAFTWLAESGTIEKTAKAVMGLFDSKTLGDGLVRTLFTVKNTVELLPVLFRDARDGFAGMVDGFRRAAIVAASAYVGLQTAGAVLKGVAIVWSLITSQTKMAATAAIVYEAIVSKGLLATKSIAAAAAAGAAAYLAFEKLIPSLGEIEVGGIGDAGRVIQAKTDRDMKKYQAWATEQDAAAKKKKKESVPGDAAGDATQALEIESPALAANTEAIRRNTETQERIIDLNRQLLGGGSFAESAVSDVAIARSTGRGSGLASELSDAMGLIQRYALRVAAEHGGLQRRRMQDAGAA